VNAENLVSLVESEYHFFTRMKDQWSLRSGPKDMELVAHALRVLLHMGEAAGELAEYQAVVKVQHDDGGWGRVSSELESAAWVSAFLGLMLIRANAILKNAQIEESIWKSIRYFLNAQKENGRWIDSEWGDLDTTSHPVSFFNVVLALGTPEMKEAVLEPWKNGLEFILKGQSEDGGWYDETFHPTGVETTAHLGQDSLAASMSLPEGLPVKKALETSLAWILRNQAQEGSWDKQNMDHTMDCTRSTLLVSRLLNKEALVRPAMVKAIDWIVANKNSNGWPDFPGMETNLERTCDGLDLLLKYQAWNQSDAREVIRRWGYVPGETTFMTGVPDSV